MIIIRSNPPKLLQMDSWFRVRSKTSSREIFDPKEIHLQFFPVNLLIWRKLEFVKLRAILVVEHCSSHTYLERTHVRKLDTK